MAEAASKFGYGAAFFTLGKLHLKKGDLKAASLNFNKAAKVKVPVPEYILGYLNDKLCEDDSSFNELENNKSMCYLDWYNLGVTYQEEKNIEKCLKCYKHVIELIKSDNREFLELTVEKVKQILISEKNNLKKLNNILEVLKLATNYKSDTAPYLLGCIYETGVKGKLDKNKDRAIDYYIMASERKNVYALNHMAKYYLSIKEDRLALQSFRNCFLIGVKDPIIESELIHSAVDNIINMFEAGNLYAGLDLALLYIMHGLQETDPLVKASEILNKIFKYIHFPQNRDLLNYINEIMIFQHLKNYAEIYNSGFAFFLLADFFSMLDKDDNTVLEYAQKALDLGIMQSASIIAKIYIHDPNRRTEAIELLQTSYAKGDPMSAYTLGLISLSGEFVEQNSPYAFELFEFASSKGIVGAKREIIVNRLYNPDLSKSAASKLLSSLEKIASTGDPDSYYALAKFYYDRNYGNVVSDSKKAFENCEQAVQLGSISAKKLLGRMYFSGDGIEKNLVIAKMLFEQSIACGIKEANYELANWYLYNKMFKEAIKYYEICSSELNDYKSEANLVVMYSLGEGCNQDIQKAVSYMVKSIKHGGIKNQSYASPIVETAIRNILEKLVISGKKVKSLFSLLISVINSYGGLPPTKIYLRNGTNV